MASAPGLSDGERESASITLDNEFLQGSPPTISKTVVDFKKIGLDEYDGLYAVILEDVLSKEECRTLVRLAEQSTVANSSDGEPCWERAMVNIGNGRQMMAENTRKCGRIIIDSQDVVHRLWARISSIVPELHKLECRPDVTGEGPAKRQEVWRLSRLNERMRFLKYTSGEYFKPHQDGMYETPDKKERTYYTVHLYLNESTEDDPLEGGATTFHSIRSDEAKFDVQPKMGSILIFQQRWLYHSGAEVLNGTKLTMRTELMYEKVDELGPPYVPRHESAVKDGGDLATEVKRKKIGWIRNRLSKKE